MKRILAAFILILAAGTCMSAYTDHRNRDVDSLERVVAPWTQDMTASAADADLVSLADAWDGLMNGYLQTNGYRSRHYAHKLLDLATAKGWDNYIYAACKVIGQHYWATEAYDSAAVFYSRALEAVDRMAAGSTPPAGTDNYSERATDDAYSAMYGTLGNLYNIMDSIPQAALYYGKAEEIFKKYGWTTSLAVLYYNMGEMYLEADDMKSARHFYEESLARGREAGDSLWIASPLMSLGGLYVSQGRYHKAVRYLLEADRYFSQNEDQEARGRIDTLDFLTTAYKAQKNETMFFAVGLAVILLLLLSYLGVLRLLKRTRKEMKETETVLDETIGELRPDMPCGHASSGNRMAALTERERQIVGLVAAGKTNPQIAQILSLSPETIKWYRKKLLVKLGAANTAELVKICVEQSIQDKHE